MSLSDNPPGEPEKGAPQEVEVLDPEIVATEKIIAGALTTYDPLAKEIGELKESVEKTVYDLTKSKDNKEARRVRAAIKSIPGKLDAAYDQWNRPILQAGKKMRERRDELKDMVPGIIAPLDKQIELDEQRRADEKAEADRKEALRVGEIRKKIASISALSVTMLSESSDKLQQVIAYLEQQDITADVFHEFVDETKAVLANSIAGLKTILVGALDREQKERDLEKLRIETEAKAEQDRLDREKRAEDDRIAAEKIETQRKENEAAAQRLRDEEAATKAKDLENLTKVAEDQQRLRQEQQDAFEDERKVANQVALIQNRVIGVSGMIDVEKIEIELQAVRDVEVIGGTEDLRAQVTTAINEGVAAIERMLERTKATNAILDAQAQAAAQAKISATEAAAESAKTAQQPAADAPSLEDALLEANEASASGQLPAEELAMQTIQETGGTARAPAGYVGRGTGGSMSVQSAGPTTEQRASVEKVVAAQRPTDAIILHTLATTFGVTEREALDWLQDMDMFEMARKVDGS